MNRVLTHFLRALARRCPNCGSGGIFLSHFKMVDVCPGCDLRLEERDEGYFTGAIVTNYFIAVGWFVALLVLANAFSQWLPFWTVIQWAGVAIAIISPLVFWPFSKTLWVALDISARPVQPEDFGRRTDPSARDDQTTTHQC